MKSEAVDALKAVTGATTLPDCDWQPEQEKIQLSAERSPVGRRKYSFDIVLLEPKKIFSGFAITAIAVTLVAVVLTPFGPFVPAPHEMVSFE